MKSMLYNWLSGLEYLFGEDTISFYAFFTTIFAECAYLWAFCKTSIALPLSIILLCYVANAISCAWLRVVFETKLFKYIYIAVYVILFIVGCIINFWLCLIMTLIAFSITALWIQIRSQQIGIWFTENKFLTLINNFFQNKFVNFTSQILIVFGPFVVMTVFIANITALPLALKIILPIVYLLCAPFIAFFEDDYPTCNIFELAYDDWAVR